MTLLGAPVIAERTVNAALKETIVFVRSMKRQSLLSFHDALCLLKNSVAMLKLLYIFRTSPYPGMYLRPFSMFILQWKQALLPVHIGELGVRSACSLAPCAFLASDAVTLPLQEDIQSAFLTYIEDTNVSKSRAT